MKPSTAGTFGVETVALMDILGLKRAGWHEWNWDDALTGKLAIWRPTASMQYVICPRGETVRMDPKSGGLLLFDTPEAAMRALLEIETAAAKARLADR